MMRMPDWSRGRLFFLLLFAVAWPWEIFQRVPILGGTVASWAGLVCIAWAIIEALFQRRLWRRTGLEAPIALLAVACLQSASHTLDWGLTAPLLRQYLLYLVLFYAVYQLVRTPSEAVLLCSVFMVSCVFVGLFSLICAGGVLHPAYIGATHAFGRRMGAEVQMGALMRIAATTLDFNQGVFPLLLALPMAALLWSNSPKATVRWGGRAGVLLMLLVLTGGIVVSFSRSSILGIGLVLALFFATCWLRASRKGWVLTAIAACVGVGVVLLWISGYGEALWLRALRGLTSRDASYQSRLYVFQLAGRLLPTYAWFGTGLGASVKAIAAVADPQIWQGTVIHSVPGRFLLETGILGLVGYLWLWGGMLRLAWRRFHTAEDQVQQRLAGVVLLVYGVGFWILLVQPFMALSLFPFLLALFQAGLRVEKASLKKSADRGGERGMAVLAGVLIVLLVMLNVTRYQQTCRWLFHYGDVLETGIAAEQEGDWEAACLQYEDAANRLKGLGGVDAWEKLPYSDVAMEIAGLAWVCDAMEVAEVGGHLRPVVASALGLARVAYARGDFKEARTRFEQVLGLSKADIYAYMLAETYWAEGTYAKAIQEYGRAGILPQTADFKELMARLEDSIRTAALQEGVESGVEAANIMVKQGRFWEAIAMCREVLQAGDVSAEACFLMGVDAECTGEKTLACDWYERAVAVLPSHQQAQLRLSTLVAQQP